MTRHLATIAADLRRLTAADFDDFNMQADGMERLNVLCDELAAIGAVCDVAPLMFQVMERLPDADLGSPGPLVHTLESLPGYEPFLRESVLRAPTRLTLWMVNRIANARPPDWATWVTLLKSVAGSSSVAGEVREEAEHFVQVQHAD